MPSNNQRRRKNLTNNIIADFEEKYHEILKRDGHKDTTKERVRFYAECFILLRDGPRLQYPTVQNELVNYYIDKWTEARKKLKEESERN